MRLTTAEALSPPATEERSIGRKRLRRVGRVLVYLALAYLLLFGIHAWLGRWTPEYLQGRDLWHFTVSRMVVPMVLLGAFASLARLVPATVMLAAALLFIGTVSEIKRQSTGEPFQVSDLFLAGQSMHLTGYVAWHHWLIGAALLPAAWTYARGLRLRWWSLPALLVCAGLLSTYRVEAVSRWIHDNSWRIGVENLTFSQAESERMNGLATHLYFSTAGLRLKTFAADEVRRAIDALHVPRHKALPPVGVAPDIYVVLGEAWWRDPDDKASPLDVLRDKGFAESTIISPVYGGTTPNAEFEALTAIPVKSFQGGIIPYQHYIQYITPAARALPRLLEAAGYRTSAYHNFVPRFWLRDKIYPKLGFGRFISMEDMTLTIQSNDWPTDEGLYQSVLKQVGGQEPQFHFLVTVQTHGPYAKHEADAEGHEGVEDYRARLAESVSSLIRFEAALREKGRPFVIVLFGDHLPGLRLHQWKNGMKSESDPRLHQVPLLVASNAQNPARFAQAMQGRPLYCLAPLLMEWAGQEPGDRYFRHVAARCAKSQVPAVRPSEAVIQNQLFSERPL